MIKFRHIYESELFLESEKDKESKKGTKKIYSDSYWDVYKITTYPAAQLYGSDT